MQVVHLTFTYPLVTFVEAASLDWAGGADGAFKWSRRARVLAGTSEVLS